MDCRDYLVLAEELSLRTSAACWRTAVSRAYYSAFHRTREFLANLGFRTRQSDQAHAGLYRRLSSSNVRELNEAARLLMELRRIRNQADYEFNKALPKTEAIKSIDHATQIFEMLDGHCEPESLVSMTDTIRAYERDVLREVTWHAP